MTEQERQLIQGLATRIQNAPPPQIDPEADELIRRSITRPDALYLLVQTVLIQDMALNQAKAQIDDLKQRASAPSGSASGFLPNEPNARPPQPGDWGRDTHVQQPAPQAAQYQGSGYQPPPAQPSGGGMGSFLRSAATTAAGVIAGETAFSALSSLFGHHGGYGGGSGFLSGGPISPGSETVINNYYEDDRDRGNDRDNDRSAGDDDIRSIDDQDDQNYDQDADDSSRDDSDSDYDDNGSDDDGSVDA